MAFHSIVFITIMFPIIILMYYLIPKKWNQMVLLGSSIFLYAWQEPKYVFLLILLILVNYVFANFMDQKETIQRKRVMIEIIIINIIVLAYFKYYNGVLQLILPESWHVRTIMMPLGISFFMFQIMGYIFDVYHKRVHASHRFIDFMTYIFFFPKLTMGPIVPYKVFMEQMQNVSISIDLLALGIKRFIIGLAQKVILATTFSTMIGQMELHATAVIDHWLIILAYTLQIYFDFAGYSNMAIGLANMLGYSLVENFNYPYISKSISEFWRRWHISLGVWFKNYVYIPLGGNRIDKKRHILNLLVVWILTGIWHGSTITFVFWGVYFWGLLVLEKYVLCQQLKRLPEYARWLITMLFIMIGWVIFRSESLLEAISFIGSMFYGKLIGGMTIWYVRNYGLYLIIGVISSLPIIHNINYHFFNKNNRIINIIEVILLLILFMISIAYIIGGSYQSFLYTQF